MAARILRHLALLRASLESRCCSYYGMDVSDLSYTSTIPEPSSLLLLIWRSPVSRIARRRVDTMQTISMGPVDWECWSHGDVADRVPGLRGPCFGRIGRPDDGVRTAADVWRAYRR